MSNRDLRSLRSWARRQAEDLANPARERKLWKRIVREVDAYDSSVETGASQAGAPRCSVCGEFGGRHRTLITGRFVSGHDESEGLLW